MVKLNGKISTNINGQISTNFYRIQSVKKLSFARRCPVWEWEKEKAGRRGEGAQERGRGGEQEGERASERVSEKERKRGDREGERGRERGGDV